MYTNVRNFVSILIFSSLLNSMGPPKESGREEESKSNLYRSEHEKSDPNFSDIEPPQSGGSTCETPSSPVQLFMMHYFKAIMEGQEPPTYPDLEKDPENKRKIAAYKEHVSQVLAAKLPPLPPDAPRPLMQPEEEDPYAGDISDNAATTDGSS